MDCNVSDYIDSMIKLTNYYINNVNEITSNDLDAILVFLKTIKRMVKVEK